jgi:hypothetical protein
MKNVHHWLYRLMLALVVSGSVFQARAAMSLGTTWTAEEGFLSRMIPDHYFTQANPTIANGITYIDSDTGYGYTVGLSRGTARLTFTSPPAGPAPTGVGGFFGEGKSVMLTFWFNDGTSVQVSTDGTTGFGGYTTDVDPSIRTIKALSFSALNPPTELYVGLDTVVPEPSTVLAGGLLLLPFAAGAIRRLRKKT